MLSLYNNMDKSKNKQSQENISMPKNKKSKKSDLEKALEYYGVEGKSITAVATAIKFKNPTMAIKRKDGTIDRKKITPSNEPNSYFANKVREEIVKKWKTSTQEYINNYKVFFKRYDKNSKKYRDVYRTISIQSTKGDMELTAQLRYEELQKEMNENYDDIDPESFAISDAIGEAIPVMKGEGIKVTTGIVYSTASGGQRKVGRSGSKAGLKMRFTQMRITKDKQEWDTGRGRCVFDYILWKYKDVSGFKKELGKTEIIKYKGIECSKSELFLNELFKQEDGTGGEPLVEGVNIFELENFADKFGVPIYAFDIQEGLIEYYKPPRDGKGEPLIFTCYAGHFNPVMEKQARKIKVSKATYEGNALVSNTEEIIGKVKGERKEKEIIAPTEEEWEQHREQTKQQKQAVLALGKFIEQNKIPNGRVTEFWFEDKLLWNTYNKLKEEAETLCKINFQNKFALDFLKENEMEVPYPLTDNSVQVEDGSIQKMIYDDKIILTKPIDQRMKRYMEDNGKSYQGETFVYAMNDIWKQLYPFELTQAPFLSNPNDEVMKALTAENVKYRTHIGRTTDKYTGQEIKHMLLTGEAISVDIKRCYADCIYNQREEFIRFTGREQIEEYKGKGDNLTLGLYFVETEDNMLFHKSNWYSRKIIDKARKEKIKYKITHQIRCIDESWSANYKMPHIKDEDLIRDSGSVRNEVLPHPSTHRYMDMKTLFKEFCDAVVEQTEQDEDMTLTKLVINSLTGYLGKVNFKARMTGLTNNLEELWSQFIVPEAQTNKDMDIFVNPIEDENIKLYLFGYNYNKTNLSNGLPMYIQLLDWSNLALYDLMKNIGGEIVFRKTDMVVSVGGKLDKKYVAEEECVYQDTFGTYYQDKDMEKIQNSNFDFMEKEERGVLKPKLSDDWIVYDDFKSSSDWEAILNLALEKGGLCISGRAGTGKSYIIHKGIEAKMLPDEPKTRLSFTNRAARNINGTTIHKALAINMEGKTNNKTMEGQKKYKIYVVDEISMINGDLWNKLMLLKKKTGAIFILLGDHRQCPPIEQGQQIDYFTHPYAKHLCNNNMIELSVPQRYDLELWKWLEDYYEEGIEGEQIIKKKIELKDILYRKNICYYNKTRKEINEICMGIIKKDKTPIFLKYEGTDDKQQDAYIYKDLPVMAITNNKDYEIINSEEFIVTEYSSANSDVTLAREEDPEDKIVVELKHFHKNFVVNYASTTHKSQGATITKGLNLWDWSMLCRDRRIGYTAVSRAKTCDQVWINVNYSDDAGFSSDEDDYGDADDLYENNWC